MEHYLKITEEGVFAGKKQTNSDEIVYDESLKFDDFDEGYEWLHEKFGVEKREIHYIHQLDV